VTRIPERALEELQPVQQLVTQLEETVASSARWSTSAGLTQATP
jgi:hypothetical protein